MVELILNISVAVIGIVAFVSSYKPKIKPTEEDYNRVKKISFFYFLLSMFLIILNIIRGL